MTPPTAARRGERERLDTMLHRRGLARSRSAAQALVMSGRVRVDGNRVDKPGTLCHPEARIEVEAPAREWVSRGGIKLAAAIETFGIDPAGRTALDVGASTGGFTECLLRHGARHVVALDVGRGQLDWSLRRDPRVTVLEGINARYLTPDAIPGGHVPFDLAVCDVSFISLRLVLRPVGALLREDPDRPGTMVALVKPQFEVGPARVGRGGIVRDATARRDACLEADRAARDAGFAVLALAPSALRGAEGNQEYFLHLARGVPGATREEIESHAIACTDREAD